MKIVGLVVRITKIKREKTYHNVWGEIKSASLHTILVSSSLSFVFIQDFLMTQEVKYIQINSQNIKQTSANHQHKRQTQRRNQYNIQRKEIAMGPTWQQARF